MQIWLKFDDPDDEEASHAANIFTDEGDEVRIEWWNEAVGLVTTVYKDTVADAEKWLEDAGYQDFTS